MRLKATLRNLYISQFIILVFLFFSYYIWFPYSFSELGGFKKTALMLIFVDLILGPLLVYIVFKEGKNNLRFDLNTLLIIQLGAFFWGAYSLYLKHPAYAVFKNDHFVLMNVSQLYPQPTLVNQLKNTVFSHTKLVSIEPPQNEKEFMSLVMSIDLFGTPDIEKRPKYFVPIKQHEKKIMEKSLQLDDVFSNVIARNKLQKFIEKHGNKISDYSYFPLIGNNNKYVTLVLSRHHVEPIGIIDVNPWEFKLAAR